MKASESVKNYPSERRMYANYVARNIKKLIKEVGPRPAGTDKEKAALEWMSNDLKDTCDDVKIEEFTLSPWAFMSWVQICAYFTTIAAGLFFAAHFVPALALYFNIAAVVLTALSIFSAITEFLFYNETLDPFFKKSTSHNLVAVRRPSGEVKRRIIFSGHADSAPEWKFTYWGGPKLLIPFIVISFIGIAYTLVVSVIGIVFAVKGTEPTTAFLVIRIVAVCFIPDYLFALLFYDKKRIVDGANDNLTGCFCAMAVPRFLKDHDIRFENTEVIVVCTGAEESGLRGAKAFCKAHGDLLTDGIETVFFGLDTVRDYDYMAVYNKDMTGTVTNDAQVSALIKAGAAVAGYDLPYKTVTFGSSDAAAMTKGGFKASCFAAMDPAPARYYHTRLDTADNLDLKTIEAGVDICLETAFLYNEKGLDI